MALRPEVRNVNSTRVLKNLLRMPRLIPHIYSYLFDVVWILALTSASPSTNPQSMHCLLPYNDWLE
jgi:hypothetical protein